MYLPIQDHQPSVAQRFSAAKKRLAGLTAFANASAGPPNLFGRWKPCATPVLIRRRRATRTVLFVLVGVVTLRVPSARAQSADAAEPGRLELAIGPLWIGRQALGSSDATETTSAGARLTLFGTSTELASASGLEARVSVRLSRVFEAEVSAAYATPQLRTQIGNDFESAAPVTATEVIQQFTVGGGLIWYVRSARSASRLAPFAMAGAGYLRQLHESATLVTTGRFYQLGGGVKYLLVSRPGSHVKGIGVRIDVRALVREDGVAFDAGRHISPAVGASLFARF
jgi:hypothetical protein